MPLSIEEIREILRLIEASACEEFRLETDDVKLVVKKSASADGGGGAEPGRARTTTAARTVEDDPTPTGATADALSVPSPNTVGPVPHDDVPAGLFAVRSPMAGTFYRAPAPGATPFVEVGQEVEPDDTVCIVEVMKLMNSIPAGVRGRVVRICADNAAAVRHDQVLVLVEPAEPRDG